MRKKIELKLTVELPSGFMENDESLDIQFLDTCLLDTASLKLVNSALQNVEIGQIKKLEWNEQRNPDNRN